MNTYITGNLIKEMRKKRGMTQSQLAKKLCISDKTVSKWETGKGLPDITLIEPIAKALNISVAELFSGNTVLNKNISANVKRGKFYVCPICENVIFSIGEANITCHGITLPPCEISKPDENHKIGVSFVEDEIFVSCYHEMTKKHHISFLAALSTDRLQTVKLYPEGNAETRFKRNMTEKIYCYCNKDGLFEIEI